MYRITTHKSKAKPSQLEYHLMEMVKELSKKTDSLPAIQHELEKEIATWKATRIKYKYAETRIISLPGYFTIISNTGQKLYTVS